jgi:phosphoribosyl-AMP cyclohydrolase
VTKLKVGGKVLMEICKRVEQVDFKKGDGLVPAIVQDYKNKEVLHGFIVEVEMSFGIKAQLQAIFNM